MFVNKIEQMNGCPFLRANHNSISKDSIFYIAQDDNEENELSQDIHLTYLLICS